jgi:hypothetical protein
MDVEDEEIVSFRMTHEEGQIPTLDITVRNPRIGLLAPGRKTWAWLGRRDSTGHLRGIYFGNLQGIPTDLFQEKVTLKFHSRAINFVALKQDAAEALKVAPYYDGIWLDDQHRDDPDSILEGWSALWHIDRKTLAITASDVLEGEDGTVTFTEDDAIYSSVEHEARHRAARQPPRRSLRLVAAAHLGLFRRACRQHRLLHGRQLHRRVAEGGCQPRRRLPRREQLRQ